LPVGNRTNWTGEAMTKCNSARRIHLLAVLALGCAAAPSAHSQVTNIQTPGNLESTQQIPCGDVYTLKNTYTPPDLYGGMLKCINAGRFSQAVYFFALAGTYTWFDGLRVVDESAAQAHSALLQESLDSLGVTAKTAFTEALQSSLGKPDKLPLICKELKRIGPPNYFPRCMVQHGMAAVIGDKVGDGLVPDFDASSAWKKALGGYLHCDGG
jgi:hypothetical protein